MFHTSFNRPRTELRYTLVITFPDGEVHSFPVGDAAITVGRSPATAIRVPEDGVSRQHCVISPASGRLIVLDQGSTNGTFVNGALVRQARLNDGDVIQVGSTRIRVQARADDDIPVLRPTEQSTTYEVDDVTTETYEIPLGTAHIVQRLAERLASSDGAVSAAELVLDSVMEVIPADRAFIFTLRRGQRGGAEVLSSRTRRPTDDATGELDVEIPERVLAAITADPNLITASETTAAVRAALSERTSGPVLCAPLRHGGDAFGALYLDALTLPEWAQNAEMLGLLSSAGALAALAVSRARLQTRLNLEKRYAQREREGWVGGRDEEMHPSESGEVRVISGHRQRVALSTAMPLFAEANTAADGLGEKLGLVGRSLADDSEEAGALLEATAELGRVVEALQVVRTLVGLEAGRFEASTRRVDASELLERVIRRFESRAEARGINLLLGAVEPGLIIEADPWLVSRMLDHLVVDAMRSVKRGGRIVLSGQRRAASVELSVADTGEGVPSSRASKFFELSALEETGGRQSSVELHFCALSAKAQGGSIRVTGPNGNNRIILAMPTTGSTRRPRHSETPPRLKSS